jgi:hypothetical protein
MAKICRKAQADVSKARLELQAEHQKVADLENAEEPCKKKKKKVEWSEREIKHRDKIKKLGQKFAVCYALWLELDNGESVFDNDLDENYADTEHFVNAAGKIQGCLHDILDVLPSQYQDDLLEKDWICKPVSLDIMTKGYQYLLIMLYIVSRWNE